MINYTTKLVPLAYTTNTTHMMGACYNKFCVNEKKQIKKRSQLLRGMLLTSARRAVQRFQKLNYFIKLCLYVSIYITYLCVSGVDSQLYHCPPTSHETDPVDSSRLQIYGERLKCILHPYINNALYEQNLPNFVEDRGSWHKALEFCLFYVAIGRAYLLYEYPDCFSSMFSYFLCVEFVPSRYFLFFAAWYKGYLFTTGEIAPLVVYVSAEIFVNILWIITGDWYVEFRDEQQRIRARGEQAIHIFQRILVPEVQKLEDSIKKLRESVDFSRLNEDQLSNNQSELQSQLDIVEHELEKRRPSRSRNSSFSKHPKFLRSDQCIICCEKRPTIYFRPCYHACLCSSCGLDMNVNIDHDDPSMDEEWVSMTNSYEDESGIESGDEDQFFSDRHHLRKEFVTCPMCSTVIRGWGYTYFSASDPTINFGEGFSSNNTVTEIAKLVKYISTNPGLRSRLKFYTV